MRHQSWELPKGTTIKGELPIKGEALDMDRLTTGEVMVGLLQASFQKAFTGPKSRLWDQVCKCDSCLFLLASV